MKKHWSTVLLILVCLAGVALILYPTVSEAWNRRHQSHAIIGYSAFVEKLEEDDNEAILEAAREYNRSIAPGNIQKLTDERLEEYTSQLDPLGNGIMGYIEIPSIQCSLPIYHGTEESILTAAVGHLDWSSLPVGGENTHCVISGHRGLPSAKLFTRLDELREGDTFLLKVLNETLTYEVDRIAVVLPDEVSSLCVMEGEDLCTLVTCTPYGINTHRLLVHGHRVENATEVPTVHVTADATVIRPLTVFPFAAAPLLLTLIIGLFFHDRHKKRREKILRRRESFPP